MGTFLEEKGARQARMILELRAEIAELKELLEDVKADRDAWQDMMMDTVAQLKNLRDQLNRRPI